MVTTEEGGKASAFFEPGRLYMLYLFKRRRNQRSYLYFESFRIRLLEAGYHPN
jgi:hypothetical protein